MCDVGGLIDFATDLAASVHSGFPVKQLSIDFTGKKVIVAYFLLSGLLVRVCVIAVPWHQAFLVSS